MRSVRIQTCSLFCIPLFWVCAVAMTWAQQDGRQAPQRYVIAGRIVDPLGLRPPEAVLMLEVQLNESSSSMVRVETQADGSFVTPALIPGTYVLQVVRSPGLPGVALGLTIVSVANADVTGVEVPMQQDTALQGRFRMESDNPSAVWPPHIHVIAFLALDGAPLRNGVGAEGAAGGRFILRNAFGPRVLRPGYSLAPGSPWWPTRVLLNGADITDVPTDFSKYPDAVLEVVFTQRPEILSGKVTDPEGRAVPGAWVVVCAAEPNPPQVWATTSQAMQADANGTFRFTSVPGRYVVRAFAPSAFVSRTDALRQLRQLAAGGIVVELGEREMKMLALFIGEA